MEKKYQTREHCLRGCGPAEPTLWRPELGYSPYQRQFQCASCGSVFLVSINDPERLKAIDTKSLELEHPALTSKIRTRIPVPARRGKAGATAPGSRSRARPATLQ